MKKSFYKFTLFSVHLLLTSLNFNVMASHLWPESNNMYFPRVLSTNYSEFINNNIHSNYALFKFTDETVVVEQSWEGGILHKVDIDNVRADSYDLLINNLQVSKKGSIEVKQQSNNRMIANIKSSDDKLEIEINSAYCRFILSINQFGIISKEKEFIINSPGKVYIKDFLKARKIYIKAAEIELEGGIDVFENQRFILSGLTLKFKSLKLGAPFFQPFSIISLGNGYNIFLSPPDNPTL